MKTTIATIIALGLAGMTFAQSTTPVTPAPADSKPVPTTKVKKHHKKAVKKADKAAAKADAAAAKVAATAPAPVKK